MTKIPEGLLAQARLPSPVGVLTAAVSPKGLALLAFDEPDLGTLAERPDHPWLARLAEQMVSYWRGNRRSPAFDLPLDLQGTAFQREVWLALTRIPAGTTCCYADIAAAIGRPAAVRAVGLANGANPVAIVVPCHRVIGRDGSLTGYAGGLARKQALLQHESPQPELA